MIACLLLWALAGGAAWLVGRALLGAARAAGLPGPLPALPVTALSGLCAVTVLGGCWSLAGRLDAGAAALGLLVLAASLAAVLLLPPPERAARRPWPDVLPEALLAGLAAALAAAATAGPVASYDTGLYHVQAIRWIEQQPAVPGLANLHDRLAIGAPWFEAQALFDPAPWGGRPVFPMNGLIFAGAVAFFLGGIGGTGGIGGRATPLPLSRLLHWGSVPLAFWLLRRGLASAGPDVAVALLSWVVLLLSAEKIESAAATRLDLTAAVITGLAAFATAIKLSAAPLLLAPAWLVLANLARDRRRALAAGALAAAVVAPFVIRSVIVSGYWWFPVPWTRVPGLDWAVPPASVADLLTRIGDWARLPHRPHVPALDLAAWVPTWAQNLTPVDRLLLAALPALGLIHLARALWRRITLPAKRTPEWPSGYPWLIALALAGTLFWLVTAPDPRFGWGSYPFLALLLAAPLLRRPVERLPRGAVVVLLAVVLLDQGRRLTAQEGPDLANRWLWPVPLPAVETRATAAGGLAIHLPVAGEQCWDAPLPCAPGLEPTIVPRGTTLEAGFRRAAPPL